MPAEKNALGEIASHAAGSIIYKLDKEDGTVRLAVMDYTISDGKSAPYTKLRFPVETCKGIESPRATVKRGVEEEVKPKEIPGVTLNDGEKFHMDSIRLQPVYCEVGDDEKVPGAKHIKVFLLVSASGKFRQIAEADHDNTNEVHGPVQLIEIEKLITEMEQRSIHAHKKAIRGALHRLAEIHREVAVRYTNLLQRIERPTMSAELVDAYKKYVASRSDVVED